MRRALEAEIPGKRSRWRTKLRWKARHDDFWAQGGWHNEHGRMEEKSYQMMGQPRHKGTRLQSVFRLDTDPLVDVRDVDDSVKVLESLVPLAPQ